MKLKVGKCYMVKQNWLGEHPFTVKVVKIGLFRVYCRWTTYNWEFDYEYKDCGWVSKRRFICEEKDW